MVRKKQSTRRKLTVKRSFRRKGRRQHAGAPPSSVLKKLQMAPPPNAEEFRVRVAAAKKVQPEAPTEGIRWARVPSYLLKDKAVHSENINHMAGDIRKPMVEGSPPFVTEAELGGANLVIPPIRVRPGERVTMLSGLEEKVKNKDGTDPETWINVSVPSGKIISRLGSASYEAKGWMLENNLGGNRAEVVEAAEKNEIAANRLGWMQPFNINAKGEVTGLEHNTTESSLQGGFGGGMRQRRKLSKKRRAKRRRTKKRKLTKRRKR